MKMVHGLKIVLSSLSLFLLVFSANAKTLKVDTVTPSITDGDFTITPNGTGDIKLGSFSGVLKSSAGVISASSVDLTLEVTGILPLLSGGTGSATQNFVDLTTAQTVAGIKNFSSELMLDHITTPAIPAAGNVKLYTKSDDKIYKLNSAGTEEEIGAGGGGSRLNLIIDPSCGVKLRAILVNKEVDKNESDEYLASGFTISVLPL